LRGPVARGRRGSPRQDSAGAARVTHDRARSRVRGAAAFPAFRWTSSDSAKPPPRCTAPSSAGDRGLVHRTAAGSSSAQLPRSAGRARPSRNPSSASLGRATAARAATEGRPARSGPVPGECPPAVRRRKAKTLAQTGQSELRFSAAPGLGFATAASEWPQSGRTIGRDVKTGNLAAVVTRAPGLAASAQPFAQPGDVSRAEVSRALDRWLVAPDALAEAGSRASDAARRGKTTPPVRTAPCGYRVRTARPLPPGSAAPERETPPASPPPHSGPHNRRSPTGDRHPMVSRVDFQGQHRQDTQQAVRRRVQMNFRCTCGLQGTRQPLQPEVTQVGAIDPVGPVAGQGLRGRKEHFYLMPNGARCHRSDGAETMVEHRDPTCATVLDGGGHRHQRAAAARCRRTLVERISG